MVVPGCFACESKPSLPGVRVSFAGKSCDGFSINLTAERLKIVMSCCAIFKPRHFTATTAPVSHLRAHLEPPNTLASNDSPHCPLQAQARGHSRSCRGDDDEYPYAAFENSRGFEHQMWQA